MNGEILDFDRFLMEREGQKKYIRVLGRDCAVPAELPWWYVLKVDRMLREGEAIPGEENAKLLRQLLAPEDFDYVTGHPQFRASWFWEIIAFGWLRGEEDSPPAGAFSDEDALRVRESRDGPGKAPSAP